MGGPSYPLTARDGRHTHSIYTIVLNKKGPIRIQLPYLSQPSSRVESRPVAVIPVAIAAERGEDEASS